MRDLVDEVLLQDGVGGLPVGGVPRREGRLVENEHNVGDQQVAEGEVVVHNLGQGGEEGAELWGRPDFVGHRGEALFLLVVAQEGEEAVERPLVGGIVRKTRRHLIQTFIPE